MLMTYPKFLLKLKSSGFLPPSSVESPFPAETTRLRETRQSMSFLIVVLLSLMETDISATVAVFRPRRSWRTVLILFCFSALMENLLSNWILCIMRDGCQSKIYNTIM